MKRVDLHRFSLYAVSFVVLLAAFAGAAFAQDGQDDPPGRAARLAVAEGEVSLQPAGVQDWAAADINRPLTTGDSLWVDEGSRAELDIGSAVIRLGAGTGFSFLNLDDSAVQMRLAAGTAIINVRVLLEDQIYEVDTPNVAVSLQRPGTYRVEVNGAGDATVVKVVDGDALVSGGSDSYPVARRQVATFYGTDQLTVRYAPPGRNDALDLWSMQRDAAYMDANSRRYVAEDIPGTQDLDAYGQWQYTADYGYVWTPGSVAGDWAPYSTGTWTWVAPWGWTWVDSAPWGFAPFHYGRWVYFNTHWRWVPGPRQGRSCYAPALVAWAGGAGVAWFPLAPREPYEPAYRVSDGYLARLNGGRRGDHRPDRGGFRYANAGIAGAVIAVPRESFIGGHPIHGPGRLPPGAFAHAAFSGTPPAIAPGRQSVLGAGGAHLRAHPRASVLGRPVVARHTPPARPAAFEHQLAAIKANGNRAVPPPRLGAARGPGAAAGIRVLPPVPGRPGVGPHIPSLADREHAGQGQPLAAPGRGGNGANSPSMADRGHGGQGPQAPTGPGPQPSVAPVRGGAGTNAPPLADRGHGVQGSQAPTAPGPQSSIAPVRGGNGSNAPSMADRGHAGPALQPPVAPVRAGPGTNAPSMTERGRSEPGLQPPVAPARGGPGANAPSMADHGHNIPGSQPPAAPVRGGLGTSTASMPDRGHDLPGPRPPVAAQAGHVNIERQQEAARVPVTRSPERSPVARPDFRAPGRAFEAPRAAPEPPPAPRPAPAAPAQHFTPPAAPAARPQPVPASRPAPSPPAAHFTPPPAPAVRPAAPPPPVHQAPPPAPHPGPQPRDRDHH